MPDPKGEWAKAFGDINVNMRDNNSVGHIGHTINITTPPPSPNAIYQGEANVGEITADIVYVGQDSYQTNSIVVGEGFSAGDPFKFRDFIFKIEGWDTISIEKRAGRPIEYCYFRARLKIVQ